MNEGSNDILIEQIKYNCPICNHSHELEVRERDSCILLDGISIPFREIYYICHIREIVDEGREFVPAWVMDLDICRARASAANDGVPIETTYEEMEDIKKAIRGELQEGGIDRILSNLKNRIL